MNGQNYQDSGVTSDPFSRFWVDLMSMMSGTPFAPTASQMQDDAMKRTRQAFFDAWARHCDEFLRSDAFLEVLKKSMDSALAFKQELNEFMTKALHDQQMPARSDTDSILVVLRSLEDRVLERIDRLTRRVDALESSVSGASPDAASGKRRPKGVSQ